MFPFRIILRYIFGAGISLSLFAFLSEIFNVNHLVWGNELMWRYLWVCFILFVQIPAVVLLIIVSGYTYLTQRVFWSLFKTEYYYLFATIALFLITGLIETVFKI